MFGIYKCVLNGSYYGKDNQSTLWYRTAIDPFGGLFGMGGAFELGNCIVDEIVDPWLACKPPSYTLQTVDIYPMNDLLELTYQMPYKLSVDRPGTAGNFTPGTDGPAIAVNLRFNLEPVMLGPQRLYAPRNGYIAIGPIPSALIADDGKLVDTFGSANFEAFNGLSAALTKDLASLTPPVLFFPIRITQKWGLIGEILTLIGWGWADVESASYDLYSTYRRSRRITG